MSAVWNIKTAMTMTGHTDWSTMTITVPRGTTAVEKAIRAHEIFHATQSPPHKPMRHTEAWEWLEEAKIDWMVEQLEGEYMHGIRAFRQRHVNDWLKYGQKSSLRQCAKVALISRGYRISEYVASVEDKLFIAKALSTIASQPSDDDQMDLAAKIDERFKVDGPMGWDPRGSSYTDARRI